MSKWKWLSCKLVYDGKTLLVFKHTAPIPLKKNEQYELVEADAYLSVAKKNEALEILVQKLMSRLQWVYDGIEHFSNDEDQEQVNYLRDAIVKDLVQASKECT